MTIVIDAVTTCTRGVGGSPLSWVHTVTTTGFGRILLVWVGFTEVSDNPVSSITYSGEPLTMLKRDWWSSASLELELWYLCNPLTGANTIAVTGGGYHMVTAALSYTGVNIVNPFGTELVDHGTSGDSDLQIDLASAANELCVDAAIIKNTRDAAHLVEGGGQTNRFGISDDTGSGTQRSRMEGSEEAGATTVSMTWTKYTGTEYPAIQIGVPLKPYVAFRTRLIKYFTNTFDPRRRILDIQGRAISSDQIEVDAWIRSEGPFMITPKKTTSLIEDPSTAFIESLNYHADRDTLNIEAVTEMQLESLFRRLSGRF